MLKVKGIVNMFRAMRVEVLLTMKVIVIMFSAKSNIFVFSTKMERYFIT